MLVRYSDEEKSGSFLLLFLFEMNAKILLRNVPVLRV